MLEKLKRKIKVNVSEWRFFRYPCIKRILMADSSGENSAKKTPQLSPVLDSVSFGIQYLSFN